VIEKTRLEELSLALPDDERKALLERISRRMEREGGEDVIVVELADNEREKIIDHDMKEANWLVRFSLWLRTFFTGRSRRDIFLEIRLRIIKSRIRAASPGITGFETRDLTPRFARRLYDVYTRLHPLLPVIQALTSEKETKAASYTSLVESRYEKAKKKVEDFITGEEMELVYARSGDAEEIRKMLALRLNDHIRASPESLFQRLEEECQLLLDLGKLSLFPFGSLFRYFSFLLPDSSLPEAQPVFEHAPVMLTLDLLERLYAAFTLLGRNAPAYQVAEEPVRVALGCQPALPGDEQEAAGKDQGLAQVREQIVALAREVEGFSAGIPLLDLLRFFRRDPYYNLMFNPPRLYLKSLYFTTLKARIGKELEEKLETIKERVILRKIEDVLRGHRMVEVSFYRENQGFDFRKLGLPSFSHVRSLTFVYNYLLSPYRMMVQEAVQIVANTALASNRITQNRLTSALSGLEDLEAKIMLFDRSLSPEEEDGKQIARFRFNVSTDLLLQKSYRAFVSQKDREARELIERARDSLAGVKRIFDEIRTSTFESTRSLMKTLQVYRGKNQTLAQIVNGRAEAIGSLLSLLDQLLELEKGS
jgi:hypothetical protein